MVLINFCFCGGFPDRYLPPIHLLTALTAWQCETYCDWSARQTNAVVFAPQSNDSGEANLTAREFFSMGGNALHARRVHPRMQISLVQDQMDRAQSRRNPGKKTVRKPILAAAAAKLIKRCGAAPLPRRKCTRKPPAGGLALLASSRVRAVSLKARLAFEKPVDPCCRYTPPFAFGGPERLVTSVGSARSGVTFHATHGYATLAVLRGRKRWYMYPSQAWLQQRQCRCHTHATLHLRF